MSIDVTHKGIDISYPCLMWDKEGRANLLVLNKSEGVNLDQFKIVDGDFSDFDRYEFSSIGSTVTLKQVEKNKGAINYS